MKPIVAASIAGEWGLGIRALERLGNSSFSRHLPKEVEISKFLQIGDGVRRLETLSLNEFLRSASTFDIQQHDADQLLNTLKNSGLVDVTSDTIRPNIKQKDLFKVSGEMWEENSNDFEKFVVDTTHDASTHLVDIDTRTTQGDMLKSINENTRILYTKTKERGIFQALSSRSLSRSYGKMFSVLSKNAPIDSSTLKEIMKIVDDATCIRVTNLTPEINGLVGGNNENANQIIDWVIGTGLLIPHSLTIENRSYHYIFPIRTVDDVDVEKISPDVRDIISHFKYASEFSTIKDPSWIIGALADRRSVGPALDIPNKYTTLISKGLVVAHGSYLKAVDIEKFRRAEFLLTGGENVDFSKRTPKIPDIPMPSRSYGETQSRIILEAAKRGGLQNL